MKQTLQEKTMISKIKICLILIFQGLLRSANAADWSYTGSGGVDNWATVYADDCAKSSQSPISLPPWIQMTYLNTLGPFQFTEFSTRKNITLKNNGHTVQGDVPVGSQVTGGGLGDIYKTAQFHFHWGSDIHRGSEHTYNGKTYPAEVHIVNYNTKYNSLSQAADKQDGLAVLGAFLEIGEIHNCKFEKLLSSLKNIEAKDCRSDVEIWTQASFHGVTDPVHISVGSGHCGLNYFTGTNDIVDGFKLDYLLPDDTSKFFRYKGSLTTPVCYESVTWTVFFNKLSISEEQLAMFRHLYLDENKTTIMVDNWRPPQPLNGRPVYISFDVQEGVSGSSAVTMTTGLLLLCISFTFKLVSV